MIQSVVERANWQLHITIVEIVGESNVDQFTKKESQEAAMKNNFQ